MKQFLSLVLTLFLAVSASAYEGKLDPGVWQQSWNDALKNGLTQSGLLDHKESQIDRLCPKYSSDSATRLIFWRQLFVALAWKESMHGPRNYIKFNGGLNKGLYQINPALRDAYKCDNTDLYDPVANIKCAVKMAAKLTTRDGSFLKGKTGGMAAYWQPLRDTSKRNSGDRAYILGMTNAACKSGKIAYISTSKNLVGLSASLAEAFPRVNTIDDLGLTPEQLGPSEDSGIDDAPNFSFDPNTEIFTELWR